MPKVLLDVALIDLCGTGQTRAQRVPGKQCQPFFLGQVWPDTGVQYGLLDQARNVFVVQAGIQSALAIA